MTSLLEIFTADPLAALFGGLGLTCQLIWPLFSSRRMILTVQLGIGANYGVQYALLEAWSGAGIAFLGATQTAVALSAGDRPFFQKLGLIFLPVVGLISGLTWDGYASLFAMTACTLVMIGRLQADTLLLRVFLLAAAPFGIGYDLAVGAAPALCGAISSATLSSIMLVREMNRRGLLDGELPGKTILFHHE